MKKMDVSYGGGGDTILYYLKENKFFSYEKDHLHACYGGRQYYSSRTGLSGAGYLDIDVDDLVEFPTYRVDCREPISLTAPIHQTKQGAPIYGFVPTTSHKGVTRSHPIVFTDGQKVVFLPVMTTDREDCLFNLPEILGFEGLLFKKIEVPYFDVPGDGQAYENYFTFGLYNPYHCKGVNAIRFTSFPFLEFSGFPNPENYFQKTVGIYCVGNDYYHFHKVDPMRGYWDIKLDFDPYSTIGEIINGWISDGNGMFWRRDQDKPTYHVFYERVRPEAKMAEGLSPWCEYELEVPIFEFHSKPIEEWNRSLKKEWLRKVIMDYAYVCPEEGLREEMETSLEKVVSLQNSLDLER